MSTARSFYWHDYETFGVDPRWQRPSQFAGIRTDLDFNVIGEPLNILCQPSTDVLPEPEACLITGITPQQCLEQGLPEYVFAAKIYEQMMEPGTCSVGYNSIRFDDEFSRHLFYRNFYDPYEREWQNGNSRWDLLDVMRMVKALRPEGITWPTYTEGDMAGRDSFRLEHLTAANGLAHESAHDALSDVLATVALAKKVKQVQPRLFEYAFQLRDKRKVAELFDLQNHKPVFHVSSKLSWQQGYGSLLMPLWQHPVNNNGIVCYDLAYAPDDFIACSEAELKQRLFTRNEDLPRGVERIHLKTIHVNKSPMVANLSVLDESAAQRLQIDRKSCELHWQQLLPLVDGLKTKVMAALGEPPASPVEDAEFKLYGGFLGREDKKTCMLVRQAGEADLSSGHWHFEDNRLQELLFRYRARNFPASLTEDEQEQWEEFRYQRLTEKLCDGYLTLEAFHSRIAALAHEGEMTPAKQLMLEQLADWGEYIL